MADESSAFERFVALAKRELAADDVRVLAVNEPPPEAPNVLVARLADGGHVVASFATEPKDRDALSRRLAMLASTFTDALAAPPSEKMRARPRPASSLHEELKALANRARAIDAVVIDTDSPVVWACASVPARPRARNELLLRDVSDRELAVHVDESGPLQDVEEPSPHSHDARKPAPAESMAIMSGDDDDDDDDDEPEATESEAARRAIAAVRRLPLDGVHKGRHLRHVERDRDFYLVLSFSGIYLLCLVFEGDFDELRAERAAAESLPRIERLVQALPPLDPDPPQPMGGVVALRGRRRR
ncbi:MAG: hypothetical protein KIT84_12465 [Labilithrix sp.]|nr:hypothetical protein [Labilithrix sp.]MCW5811827.1 hypothetical protein [Labilithrix sp.]